MLVLGVDPGTRNMGWGVIDVEGTRLTHVAHGIIRAKDTLSLAERLEILDDGLHAVLERHPPQEAAVETLFFARDASAAGKLGHARGVVLLRLRRERVAIFEYAPATVKRAVGAHGQAQKAQVASMVAALLRLRDVPAADAGDALAIAITHVQSALVRRLSEATRR